MTQTLTPDNIVAHLDREYGSVDDLTLPGREEIRLLFSRFGTVTQHPTKSNVFSVVIDKQNCVFRSRTEAWDFYLRNRDRLEQIALDRVCPF
jgi:hypothetical protein